MFLAASAVLLYRPGSVAARAFVALSFLGCVALENSFGSINHYAHLPLWLALCFVFLPGGTLDDLLAADRRAARRRFLATFFLAQALAGLFYTLSGLHKVYFGVFVPDGRVSSFAPDALPLLVVHRWLQTGEAPLLQEIFLAHGWIAWPGYLLVLYLETFAFVAAFRPALHRLWGTGLMVFHVLVWALMGIPFRYQPMLVAMLFLLSPFDPPGAGVRRPARPAAAVGRLSPRGGPRRGGPAVRLTGVGAPLHSGARCAPVAELVDAADSKSVGRKAVLVRVRPGAPTHFP